MGSDWIRLEEAWERIEAHTVPLASEKVALQRAGGRILARPVHADRDYPPFFRAAMDGFALRSADVREAAPDRPVLLQVVGESVPGKPCEVSPRPGAALRIMTGAPVPPGWDAIAPVEWTSGFDTNPVQVRRHVSAGAHIAPLGCERGAGEPVLAPGTRLDAARVGALAMLGVTEVEVGRRPRVAVLATGNELVASDRRPMATQIRDSNTALLMALVGPDAEVYSVGRSPDTPEDLAVHVARGLLADVLLVTGGVSMGAYDGVAAALEASGVTPHFRRVALQPGKPVLFGTHPRGAVLALPGNPVSAFTTGRLFASPLLRRLQGMTPVRPPWSLCAARFEWRRRTEKFLFLPGRRVQHGAAVERVAYTGSGDLLAYGNADCQIVLPPEVGAVAPGDLVRVWPL